MCSTFTTLLLFFLGLPYASTLPLELLLLIHLLLYALIVIVINVQSATTYLDLTVESEHHVLGVYSTHSIDQRAQLQKRVVHIHASLSTHLEIHH